MDASVPFQPTQFQDLKGLDTNLILTNLAEGDFFENVNAHLFDTNRLPAHARDSYVDGLKKQMNQKFGEKQGISDWFIDTITDPWVILTALFVPGAAGGLMRGVGGIFRPLTSNFIRAEAPLLGQAGLLGGFQLYRNAPQIAEAALAMRNEGMKVLASNAKTLIPAREAVVKRLSQTYPEINMKSGLDPQLYREGSKVREVVQDINDAMYSRLYGLERDVTMGSRIQQKTAVMETVQVEGVSTANFAKEAKEELLELRRVVARNRYKDPVTLRDKLAEINKDGYIPQVEIDALALKKSDEAIALFEAELSHPNLWVSRGKRTSVTADPKYMDDLYSRARLKDGSSDPEIMKELANKWKTGESPVSFHADGSFRWEHGGKYYKRIFRGTGSEVISQDASWAALSSPEWVNSVYKQHGLDEYGGAIRQVLDDDFMRLFGRASVAEAEGSKSAMARLSKLANRTDEAGIAERLAVVKEIVDPDKFMRLFRARGINMSGTGPGETTGEEFLRTFFNNSLDDVSRTVDKGKIKSLHDEIYQVVSGQSRRGTYFPSSATHLLDDAGNIQRDFHQIMSAGGKATTTPAGSILQKTKGGGALWDMNFLNRALERASKSGNETLVNSIERKMAEVKGVIKSTLEGPNGAEIKRMGGVLGSNASVERTLVKHLNETSQTYSMHHAGVTRLKDGSYAYDPKIWGHITAGQRQYAKNLPKESRNAPMYAWDEHHNLSNKAWKKYMADPQRRGATISTVFEDAGALTPEGGFSIADVLEQGYVAAGNKFDRKVLRDVLLPRMLGRKTLERSAADITALHTKIQGRKFVEGDLGKAVRERGGWLGKSIVDKIDVWSHPENIHMGKGGVTGQLTKYLYATHLGANPASVMLNLFQPLLLTAPWAGADVTLKAYGAAFKEMGGYLKERLKTGNLFQSPEAKEALIKKSFKHADELGIGPGIYENIDALTEMGKTAGRSAAHNIFFDLPMKAFEKAEWLNRLVSSHTVDGLYAKAVAKGAISAKDIAKGGNLYHQKLRDTRDMVVETQFGAGEWNTPVLFLDQFKNVSEALPGMRGISSFVKNPLIRQFTQFPTRMAIAGTYMPSQVGGGKRYMRNFLGGGEIPRLGGITPLVVDTARAMGMSQFIYHGAKALTGGELERGLYTDAVMSVPRMVGATVSGSEYDHFKPPILDMALQAGKWMTSGDKQAFANFTSRLIPGGIQMNRAMGVMSDQTGNTLGGLTTAFQKTYVDWNNPTSDGHVPMYKGDGTLIDYQDPVGVILSGMGVDMGALKSKQSDLSAYLSKQREEILGYRREYLQNLFANNIPKANNVAQEYENKFQIPMSVTKRHLDAYAKSRIIPRDERMLDRMPTEVRSIYSRFVAGRGPEMGLPAEAFELPTATKRSERYQRNELHVNPEVLTELRRIVEENARKQGKSGPFEPYRPPFYGGE